MSTNLGTVPTRTSHAEDDPKELLSTKLDQLRERREKRSRLYKLYLAGGGALLALSPFLYFILPERTGRSVGLSAFAYGVMTLMVALAFSPRELDEQIARVGDELELLAIKDTSREQRAQKLLKLHQSELKRYYDQTLSQTSVIFFAGLVCIVLGFVVVGGSLYIIWQTPTSGLQQKLILGGLGAIGGILSNFVAVMYLRMFTQTISSLAEFHNRLVSTHNLYFGNFLMSKINRNWNLYERVLSEIAGTVTGHEPRRGTSHSREAGEPPTTRSVRTRDRKPKPEKGEAT
jgi:MFS family permease